MEPPANDTASALEQEQSLLRPLRRIGRREDAGDRLPLDDDKSPEVDRLTLIIPVYNEAASIGHTVESARATMAQHGIEVQILVVDDGSTDDTARVARLAGGTVIKHLYNRGYGHALRSGILAAQHDTIAICDADGTYPLERIPDLLAEYHRGHDLVIGARTGPFFRGSLLKSLARWGFLKMCESATGTPIPDANSGLRLFSRERVLPYLPMMCGGFSFTTSQTLCYMLRSHSVTFVPVAYHDRVGRTKVHHFRDSLRTAQYICQMYVIFNPIKLFALLASLPIAAGLLFMAGMLVADGAGLAPDWSASVQTLMACGGVSLLLMGMGMTVFATGRQRWPEVVSGIERGPDALRSAREEQNLRTCADS